jgi:hypothetical protein
MARGYDPAAWQAFSQALVGAAAALAGMLFVAVSVNLERILERPDFLPPRAAETLAAVLVVLVSCALTLVPQNTRRLGIELLVIALTPLAVTPRQLATRRERPEDSAAWHRSRIATTAAPAIPTAITGVSVIVHWGGLVTGSPGGHPRHSGGCLQRLAAARGNRPLSNGHLDGPRRDTPMSRSLPNRGHVTSSSRTVHADAGLAGGERLAGSTVIKASVDR